MDRARIQIVAESGRYFQRYDSAQNRLEHTRRSLHRGEILARGRIHLCELGYSTVEALYPIPQLERFREKVGRSLSGKEN